MPPTRDVNAKVIDDLVKKDINENNAMIFSKSGYPYCTKVCFILYDGEEILNELINKTKQNTVSNIIRSGCSVLFEYR